MNRKVAAKNQTDVMSNSSISEVISWLTWFPAIHTLNEVNSLDTENGSLNLKLQLVS